jgi:hypothetical protein
MMEAVRTSQTSVCLCETTYSNIPEDCHLHARRRENLKSNHKFLTFIRTERLKKFCNLKFDWFVSQSDNVLVIVSFNG